VADAVKVMLVPTDRDDAGFAVKVTDATGILPGMVIGALTTFGELIFSVCGGTVQTELCRAGNVLVAATL
jgi:hypothetical protein